MIPVARQLISFRELKGWGSRRRMCRRLFCHTLDSIKE